MTRPIFSWRHAILKSELSPTTRHVMLTLSCHMNDAGESCFPSIATLVEETGLSNRSVIDHIKQAKEAGWIKVGLHGFGGQKWRSHEYTCAIPESEQSSERGERTSPGIEKRGEPLSIEAEERGEPASKNVVKEVHSSTSVINSTESSTNSTREAPPIGSDPVIDTPKRKPPTFDPAAIELPDWLDSELWQRWCADKKRRRKPITPDAANLQIKHLAEYREQGHTPQAVIEHSIESGYQSLYPRSNANANNQSANQPYSVGDRVRAAISKNAREREQRQNLARERGTVDVDGSAMDPPF